MKFKVTFRDKFTAEIVSDIVEADSAEEAKFDSESSTYQVLTVRPLRLIGEKPEKPVKSTYVSIKRLRSRHERDLCNKQMKLGKYSPETIAAQRVKEQMENAKDLAEELSME